MPSPLLYSDELYMINDQAGIATAYAAKFELLHMNKMNEKMLASPAMVGGTWYFRTHGHLMAVGK